MKKWSFFLLIFKLSEKNIVRMSSPEKLMALFDHSSFTVPDLASKKQVHFEVDRGPFLPILERWAPPALRMEIVFKMQPC